VHLQTTQSEQGKQDGQMTDDGRQYHDHTTVGKTTKPTVCTCQFHVMSPFDHDHATAEKQTLEEAASKKTQIYG
jgi:hypothetical protein